ncbi:MAG: prepilin-type N-terminal cleavage/methylation domain-containing protein [Actinomycetales bacterium]|nr:prepilin-type N-terminal cleavage/methylation domain-containing protein [Actinomycetales bacterium]
MTDRRPDLRSYTLGDRSRRGCRSRPGFSVIELVVVLAVIVVLTSLLLPGLEVARKGARRLVCASNQRQIGVSFLIFGRDNNDRLPESRFQTVNRPANMMALNTGDLDDEVGVAGFDGIGMLWKERYIDSPASCFCPAHRGEHTFERAKALVGETQGTGPEVAFCNYHYTGHLKRSRGDEFVGPSRRRMSDPNVILLTDGLRSRSDFNHESGFNVLRGDGSTFYQADTGSKFLNSIPTDVNFDGEMASEDSSGLWILEIWNELQIDG